MCKERGMLSVIPQPQFHLTELQSFPVASSIIGNNHGGLEGAHFLLYTHILIFPAYSLCLVLEDVIYRDSRMFPKLHERLKSPNISLVEY